MARLSSLDKLRMVRKAMGNPASGDVSDDDIAIYLWAASQELVLEHKFPSLTSYEDITTDGTNTDYTMTATDVLTLIYPGNNVTNNYPMRLMDLQWDRRFGQYFGGGGPFYYLPVSIDGGACVVRLRPAPGAGIVCRIPYLKVPDSPGITAATENFSNVPQTFDLIEVSRAAEIGLEMSFDKQSAGAEAGIGTRRHMPAEKSLPHSAFHKNNLATFHQRINRKRRR